MTTGVTESRPAPSGADAAPALTARFPKTGYELYVDHDGRTFRYFRPLPEGRQGSVQEIPLQEALALIDRRLNTQDLSWLFIAPGLVLAFLLMASGSMGSGLLVVFLLLVAAFPLTAYFNEARRVRLSYNTERPAIQERARLAAGIASPLVVSQLVWMVLGTSSDSPRVPCKALKTTGGQLQTEPPVTRLEAEGREFVLLPDGILARKGAGTTWTPYEGLRGRSGTIERLAQGPVPSDSPRLGRRWKYTTRQGLPDKRHSYNPELPVLGFGQVVCEAGDFCLHLETSRPQSARDVAERLHQLATFGSAPPQAAAPARQAKASPVPPTSAPAPAAPPVPRPIPMGAGTPIPEPSGPPVSRPIPMGPGTPATAPASPPVSRLIPMGPGTPVPPPAQAAPGSAKPEPAAASKAAAPASKPPRDLWVPAGTTVTVAGYTLPGGMLYVGSGLMAAGGGRVEDSLIDPSLPVDQSRPDTTWSTLAEYRPSYATLSPPQRAGYLQWLAGGRQDPGVHLGLVTLYFSGLERRALVDGLARPELLGEWAAIAEEVSRLRGIYKSAGFPRYADRLLEVLRWRSNLEAGLPFTPCCGVPLVLHLVLRTLAEDGRPVPGETAVAWAISERGCTVSPRLMRCGDLLVTLFSMRYRARYGSGIVLPRSRRTARFVYYPMSNSFLPVSLEPLVGVLPDLADFEPALRHLRELLQKCAEELDAYSRYLGRRPDGRHEPGALALLPTELLDHAEGTQLKQLRVFLKARLDGDGCAPVPMPELLALWPARTPGKLDRADALAMAQYLQKAEIGLEPDVRFGATASSFQEHAVAFQLPPGSPTTPSPAYQAAGLLLQCAVCVAAADGSIALEEEAHLVRHLETCLDLAPGESERLQARLRWLLLQPPSVAGLKKQLQALDSAQRQAVADFLVLTATADGRIDPAEVNALKRIFAMLELDDGTLYSRLHQVSADAGVPRATPAAPAVPGGNGGLRLDTELLERRMAETHALSSLLATVFTEEAAPQALAPLPEPEPVAAVADLDPAHSRFFRRLVTRPEWSRSDLEALAAELGLMPDGALDRLNEAALDACGDPLCDGEDPVLVDLDLAKEMTGEH